jgi:glucan phosphoethanolaminetransferase (alkaline phosphatase superfamily)
MSAFNSRLKPKEIFGMPMAAALGMGLALIFGVLSLLLPLALKLFTLPLMLVGLVVAGFAFYMGDELQWFDVMRLGRFVENNRVTSEISVEEN